MDSGDNDDGQTVMPSAPSGLEASSGDGEVSLSWDEATDADTYNVYRDTESGVDASGSPLSEGIGKTSYTDESAENGTTYYYVVSAVETSGNESDPSSEVTASPSSGASSDSRIAFQSNPDGLDGIGEADGNTEIYTVRLDGSSLRQVTDEIVSSASPTWSPDGSRVAFASNRDEDANTEIYTIRPDGSDLRQVTDPANVEDGRVADILPEWSPSGDRIALTRDPDTTFRDTTEARIYTVDPDGSDLKQVARDSAIGFYPTWSPDGSRIAFTTSGSAEIFTIQPDGSDLRRVTDRSNVVGNVGDLDLAWSPDGSRIAFTSDRDEDGNAEIYTVDPDGSDLEQVTGTADGEVIDITPAWSPDGNRIAFGRARPDEKGFDIYTIRLDGSELRRITNNDRFDSRPAWSPSQRE